MPPRRADDRRAQGPSGDSKAQLEPRPGQDFACLLAHLRSQPAKNDAQCTVRVWLHAHWSIMRSEEDGRYEHEVIANKFYLEGAGITVSVHLVKQFMYSI